MYADFRNQCTPRTLILSLLNKYREWGRSSKLFAAAVLLSAKC